MSESESFYKKKVHTGFPVWANIAHASTSDLLANTLSPRHIGAHVGGSGFRAFFSAIPITDGGGSDRAGSERGAEFHDPLDNGKSRLAIRLDFEVEFSLFDSCGGHRGFDFQRFWPSHGFDPHLSGR
jgi:hypothetical protein